MIHLAHGCGVKKAQSRYILVEFDAVRSLMTSPGGIAFCLLFSRFTWSLCSRRIFFLSWTTFVFSSAGDFLFFGRAGHSASFLAAGAGNLLSLLPRGLYSPLPLKVPPDRLALRAVPAGLPASTVPPPLRLPVPLGAPLWPFPFWPLAAAPEAFLLKSFFGLVAVVIAAVVE